MANTGAGTSRFEFATRAIWTDQRSYAVTGATVVPVYRTSTFALPATGIGESFDYSRTSDPMRLTLERQLANLEEARFASAFGSGMAAIAGVASLLSSGDHIVAGYDISGGTRRLFSTVFLRYGISTSFVDMSDIDTVREAVRANTKLFWIETPSNPTLRITDIAQIVAIRHPGQIVAVDNTLATPFFQRPICCGADIVVHSTTNYLNGHSDLVGGILITDDREIHNAIAVLQDCMGAIPRPWNVYLTVRGAKTLELRMNAHERNAQAVAEFLRARVDVLEVHYPGLRLHPQHALARRQMRGYGGVISFRPRGGRLRACEIAKSTKVFGLAVSIGGVESLICHPATMTHSALAPDQRAASGISDDLLRLSIGIENLDDLIEDLGNVLDSTPGDIELARAAEWR